MRLLELVVRELDAADARLEIGGRPPTDERTLWVDVDPPRRLVAVFDEAPADPADKRERLTALAAAFYDAASQGQRGSVPPPSVGSVKAALRLELETIADKVDARAAFVFDGSSPVVWAAHPEAVGESVDALLTHAAGERSDEPTEVLRHDAGWVIERARHAIDDSGSTAGLYVTEHAENRGALMRGLGGAYVVALLFAGGFAEPRAHGAVEHARGRLEKLIARLPPVDPPPKGGKVVRLRG